MGSFLYTINGICNLNALAAGVRRKLITPYMAYINSFMCWSAVIFGPLQILTDIAVPSLGYEWTLRFDYWYTLPNFAWAVEWGWQLLHSKRKRRKRTAKVIPRSTCLQNSPVTKTTAYFLGIRGLIIMLVSIVSIALDCRYLGGLIFPTLGIQCSPGSRHPGYDVAFVVQAVAAVVMGVACLLCYRSKSALLAFLLFFAGFVGFVLLQDLHHHLSPDITQALWFESVKEIGIKLCDNTQICFSIWFFVYMFQRKHKKESRAFNDADRNIICVVEHK